MPEEMTVMQKKVSEMDPQVALQVLLSIAHTLAMEVNGMPFSRKVKPAEQARQLCGSTKRPKQGVLGDYVAWLNETLPGGYTAKGSVAKALAV